MANNRMITAADAVLYVSVAGLFDVPQHLQGFSADDVTDSDAVEPLETMMGVDGRLSAGYIYVSVRQNITFQADSESCDLFETWDAQQQQGRTAFVATGTLLLPATGRKYAMTRGFLRSWVRLPSVKKTLQPRRATIEWERVAPAPA